MCKKSDGTEQCSIFRRFALFKPQRNNTGRMKMWKMKKQRKTKQNNNNNNKTNKQTKTNKTKKEEKEKRSERERKNNEKRVKLNLYSEEVQGWRSGMPNRPIVNLEIPTSPSSWDLSPRQYLSRLTTRRYPVPKKPCV